MANLYVTITEEITLPNTTTEKTQTFKIINGINQIVRRVDTITTTFSGSGIEIIRFCNSEAEQTGGAFVKQDVQYIRITNLSTQYDTSIYLVANDNTESALFNLSPGKTLMLGDIDINTPAQNDPVMDEIFIPAGYLPIDELTMLQDPTSAQQQGDYNIPPVKNEGFFLSKSEKLDEVYSKYKSVTNMGYAELEAWSKTECSKKASLDRAPIERNLRLLSKSKDEWTANDIDDANRTISFVSRMKGAEQGEPASEGCPSKRDISLKNWAFDPSK